MTDQDHAKIVREARVTQADREAAAAHWEAIHDADDSPDEIAEMMRSGKYDGWTSIQFFTRHRLAAEAAAFEKAAGVADDNEKQGISPLSKWMAKNIADDIRKLAGEKHD